MKLQTLHTLITEHSDNVFRGDTATAFIAFGNLLRAGTPCRVFVTEFDVETNAFETAREVTADWAADFYGKGGH